MSERQPRFDLPPEEPINKPEEREKPSVLYYASIKDEETEISPIHKYPHPTQTEKEQPKRVRASDDVAYAIGRSVINSPHKEKSLFYEATEDGIRQLILEVSSLEDKWLKKPLAIYKLPAESFALGEDEQQSGHTYTSLAPVKPSDEIVKFSSTKEAFEKYGGIIRLRKLPEYSEILRHGITPTQMTPEENRRILDELRKKEDAERQQRSAERRRKKETGELPPKQLSTAERTTPHQRKILEQYGIEVPESKAASSRFIEFILQGNNSSKIPETPAGRSRLLKNMQAAWDGKRVLRKGSKRMGRVVRLYPRTRAEVAEMRKVVRFSDDPNEDIVFDVDTSTFIGAFNAIVKWDDREKADTMYLSSLEKIEDTPQAEHETTPPPNI
jgi:hypothetical protein